MTLNPVIRDAVIASGLMNTALFAFLAPQGLTWLPIATCLGMALLWLPGTPHWQPRASLRRDPLLFAALTGFCAWLLARSVTSPDPLTSLHAAGAFLLALLGSMAAIGMASRLSVARRWWWSLAPAVAVVLAIALVVVMRGLVDTGRLGVPRLTMSWHYNRAAILLALIWPICLFSIRAMGLSFPKRAALIALVYSAIAIGVIQSISESAKLALLLITLAQIVSLASVRFVTWAAGIGAILLLLFLPLWFGPLDAAFGAAAFRNVEAGTFDARMQIWRHLVATIWQSPWFGSGVEFVRTVDGSLREQEIAWRHNHPHSFLVQTWLDLGLVGAAALALVLLAVMRRLASFGREGQRLLTPIMIGALGVWAVSHGMWQSWFIGMVGLVICVAVFSHRHWLAEEAGRKTGSGLMSVG